MDGQVHTALSQCLLDLLGKHSFGADLGKGDLLQPITGGLDDLDFDGVPLPAQQGGDVVGLPQGKLRSAASNAQVHWRVSMLASDSFTASAFSVSELVELAATAVTAGSASLPAAAEIDQASHSASSLAELFSLAACFMACIGG